MGNILSLGLIGSWIAVIISLAILCRKIWPNKKELSRKIVHIGNGPVIPMAWFLGIPKDVALTFSCLITITLLINQQLRIIPAIEDIDRKSFGTIGYGAAITILLFYMWPDNAAAVSSGVLVMAFGDGLAGLIGSNINSYRWQILNQKKSLLGTSTMFIVSFLILLLINIYTGFSLSFSDILIIALLATTLEQVGQYGLDNILVPLVVAFSWVFFQGA
ncbi:dolichol kinase [Prochlorococcus sp. MIT 1341]|uniref:diacylglycerol/polyprenol kinase family protein n=1 Tax=Prochlorococcus sp. MIT 1341 TaxID=3096221 RepID=UPI002A75AE05|nr:dolichol kinase [Prochlorococcus sp. MIT 1341]